MGGSKVIIIGLDGVTFDLIKPWIEDGSMPVMKSVIDSGVHGVLRSTFPPLTCPAWFSFSTGKNPGKLGMFNFFRLEKGSYEVRRFDNRDIRGHRELWDLLNTKGMSCTVFNNPVAYPPRAIDGIMVAGFLAPSTHSEYCYPKSLKPELDRVTGGYEIDADQGEKYDDRKVVENCLRILKKRTEAMKYLLKEHPQDVTLLVYTGTDRICHQLLNKVYSDDKSEAEWAEVALRDYFHALDSKIGEVIKAIPYDDYHLLFMSDHGFCQRDKGFYINKWLMDEGFLTLKEPHSVMGSLGITQKGIASKLDKLGLKNLVRGMVPKSLEKRVPMGVIEGKGRSILDLIQTGGIDWRATKAVALPGGIYLNTSDRPEGVVGENDYGRVRSDISEKLKAIKNPRTGERLKVDVYHREEIYEGEFVDAAPDIQFVIEDYEWGEIRNIPADGRLFDTLKVAHHNERGIFMAAGKGIRKGVRIEGANITDVAPTVLAICGISPPSEMDGRVLDEIFTQPPVYETEQDILPAETTESDSPGYTPEEEKEIEERLRGLGYVD